MFPNTNHSMTPFRLFGGEGTGSTNLIVPKTASFNSYEIRCAQRSSQEKAMTGHIHKGYHQLTECLLTPYPTPHPRTHKNKPPFKRPNPKI